MADNTNPNASKNIGSNFLPKFYQTDANKKFLQATIDQLVQPGTVKKVNGYIGRQNAKATTGGDIFISEPTTERQHYQLEPGFVVNDKLNNTTFFKDYQDYINQLGVFGSNLKNHSRLNSQEFYSWNPHIDWDKFVNFENYYWLPYGPDTITIYGQSETIASTFSVSIESQGDSNEYLFTPDGLTRNPTLKLYRGQTYTFEINSPNNPFSIKTARSPGQYDRYLSIGYENFNIEVGTITFRLPNDAPDILYYQSEYDLDLGGVIHVLSVNENSKIDVENEIIGKKTYSLSDGTKLSNGMKVVFGGSVTPVKYEKRKYYVEGVGESIYLIPEDVLELVGTYTTSEAVLFDSNPFDSKPFADASAYAGTPDYLVINRASLDHNPWSRYNRWFHKDVIETSAKYNNVATALDQSFRAIRPIIEFDANLKLFNFGTTAIDDIDLIDTFTTDVFSTIEGAIGYNVDGVQLAPGQRILFAADTDVLVKNKIYEVDFIDILHTSQTNTINTIATETKLHGNLIKVGSTANMVVGNPITFSGTSFGNIISGKPYYITSIVDSTHITVTDRINGLIVPQDDATASVAMTVSSVYVVTSKQIHLKEISTPVLNQVVLIHGGVKNQGTMFWYDGTDWKITQQKTSINQAPLFDLVDSNKISYGDLSVYDGSTFVGTKIFSYEIGVGKSDSNLGFPLSYKNINNIGDIVFNFDLLSDKFEYKTPTGIVSKLTNIGFLVKSDYNGIISYKNGWEKSRLTSTQAAVRIYKNSNLTNNFKLDIFDNINDLSDLSVHVYVNGIRLDKHNWKINNEVDYKVIVLSTDILLTDVLSIRAFASQPINANGYYEVPINLQNNPLNNDISEFTLGEVLDHVNSIVDNLTNFEGSYPGSSNIRDLGQISAYGTKFVQHSGPLSLAVYHVTSEKNNIIRAIEKNRDDYNKFKKTFINVAETLGVDTDVDKFVDIILQTINKDKPKTSPYYFSDMLAYGAKTKTDFTVVDYRIKKYSLSKVFTLETLSNKAVGVYLNGVQLLHEHDYTFDNYGFVNIICTLHNDDIISIYEYDSTDGSFIPETPSKLGIWPSYDPKIYLDTSYITPQRMIQGHDGSLVLAYGDYRDDLILELEKRIYNNIKVKYDTNIFDISDVIPGYNRTNDYSLTEFNQVLAPSFYKWANLVDRDFTKSLSYDSSNPFTFNYQGHSAPDGRETPGYWRGIYRWILDTDRPNICPWEMLGFNDKPAWWEEKYGPAPYTSDNLVMWTDISNGAVKEPNKPTVILHKYKKPFLLKHIPVDEYGNIISPTMSGLSNGILTTSIAADFVFGDVSPVESAWRRSSHYPFSVILTSILLTPAKTIGVLIDRSRITRNLTGQLVNVDTGVRIKPSDIKLPNVYSDKTRVQTAGIINYIVNYIIGDNLKSYTEYSYDLKNINCKLSHRIGSFTSKEKYNLLLDSKTPKASGSVFIPQEDYEIILNSSSPIKKLTYSGIIITKIQDGYEVKGYSKTAPYFNYYYWIQSGSTINVGGISESYANWQPRQTYGFGTIVLYKNKYYRVKTIITESNLNTYTSIDEFEPSHFELLYSLPIIGGRDAIFRKQWDKLNVLTIPYGKKFRTVQEVVDFILGYGEYLKDQGFIFDEYSINSELIMNWETSAKEFMFWTTQNWSSGKDKWQEWQPNTIVFYDSIVRYNGDYYKAIRNVESSPAFNQDDYIKLPGLSTVGSSVISLSPAANGITFKTELAMVDDISNEFNGYEIFRVDGNPIDDSFLNSYRDDNTISYSPSNKDGIYGASFFLIQKEQVVILNNTTMFNDMIYNPESGYKQDRIKVSGYTSINWNGSFNIPGFIFDQAFINEWQSWKDYALGDIIKHKEYYYSASAFLPGTETFNPTDWILLDKKPTAKMLPNWTYKASQFEDFYSLDSDNFDNNQQKMAQHLIGYQKRQYLDNIIQDDVSEFKFYQGMIIEKGTQNVLNKLFDVLSSENQESLQFYEEWALREGQYGASAGYETIEFVLDETKFKNNPQGFELVNQNDTSKIDFIIRQTASDVYLKPLGYDNNPWPIIKNDNNFLRSAGYVRSDEVKLSLENIDQILSYSPAIFTEGDYIHCSFEKNSWNVYRYTNTNFKIINISSNGNIVTIFVDKFVDFEKNTYIGISNTGTFDGFYKITNVTLNTIQVSTTNSVALDNIILSKIILYKFSSSRADIIDNIDSIIPRNIKNNELIWTDDNGTGKWTTWKYSPVYTTTNIIDSYPVYKFGYGKAVAISNTAKLSIISTNKGELIVYDRYSSNIVWTQRQIIELQNITYGNISNPEIFGTVLAMSSDDKWLAVGSPLVSNVNSKYFGEYNSNLTYSDGYVVKHNNKFYYTQRNPSTSIEHWVEAPYVSVDVSGITSTYIEQGIVSLYVKDSYNIYTLVDSFVSPSPQSHEQFGTSIVFGDNELLIGTPTSGAAGSVYRLEYKTVEVVSYAFNPYGSSETTIKLSNTTGIEPGMALKGHGFSSGQTVVEVIDSKTIKISSKPDTQPVGDIGFTITRWGYNLSTTILNPGVSGGFGRNVVVSDDFSTIAISATDSVDNTSELTSHVSLYVYKKQNNEYSLYNTIKGYNVGFATSIAVSSSGEYIAVSDISYDGVEQNQGAVYVYRNSNTGYFKYKQLVDNTPETSKHFGSKLAFINDYKTLVVYSDNADTEIKITIDGDKTTFDKGSTSFNVILKDSGRVDIYDQYNTSWVFGETLQFNNEKLSQYGRSIAVGNNTIIVGAPTELDNGIISGKVYEYTKASSSNYSWYPYHYQITKPDVKKIKQAFLYNKFTNKLLTYIDVIDPLQGKIPGIADQELSYKLFYDPAVYSTGTNLVNVDEGLAWTKNQIGSLWWDLRSAKFIDSYDEDIVYRNSTWSTLAVGASIDIYEWVETNLTPDAWDKQADTEAGLTLGISGKSLYGSSVYSIRRRYDNVAKVFKNTYYFWVKNKKTTPQVYNRKMSAYDISMLISNPRGEGYQYISLTGTNSFSLTNIKSLLNESNVVLSVEYWTIDKIDQNIHTQWKLISNNDKTQLPSTIQNKWFDSLCGKDLYGRLVPDTTLPIKLKYGVENRPRQGMFINRVEALKQFIEQANLVLSKNLISESRNLSKLETYDKEPSIITGLYDIVIDTDSELSYVNVLSVKKASISPIIVDGRITGITINQPGQGYVVSPYIEIVGNGIGAILRTTINSKGQVTGVEVVNSGIGYDNDTVLIIRNYSVLVHSDSQSNNIWAIYSYDSSLKSWSRVKSKTYDTTAFWSYIDWYADGYDQYNTVDYSVETYSELQTLEATIGKLVKVRTTTNGHWIILKKKSKMNSYDWTLSYDVVASQNGTIKFSDKLYNFIGSNIGYDGTLYDGNTFDNSASVELRYILDAIKNDIFIDELYQEYLNLFFTSVRYALSEQLYLDWIFKTSFVKAKHNVGKLKQLVTYKNDNLENFEDYVSEVKPYRTQIREYVSSYIADDNTKSMVTDFDVPAVFLNGRTYNIESTVKDEILNVDDAIIQSYPYKNWLDNIGYEVISLIITDGGSGYISEPKVTIIGKASENASARAFISNGKVNRIVILKSGKGYLAAPRIEISGGILPDGKTANVIAIIGNGVIRNNLIKIKFDRVSKTNYISQLEETEMFTGSGSKIQFQLVWAPDTRVGKTTVLVNNIEQLRETYTLKSVKSNSRGYTSYYGSITFNTAPAKDSVINVTYVKDWNLLNAADRISYYYSPNVGDIGKDLSQLMDGIDYGGVNVTGLDFKSNGGWATLPYYTDKWGYDVQIDDYTTTVSSNTHAIVVPYYSSDKVPQLGTELNVYYRQVVANPFIADGTTTSFNVTSQYFFITSYVTRISVCTGTEAGSYIVNVLDTTGIKIGDVVNCDISGVFTIETYVMEILQGAVRLNQITYGNIPLYTPITFTHPVYEVKDYSIVRNGLTGMTVNMNYAIDQGSILNVYGVLLEVRIDDPYFATPYQTNKYAIMPSPIVGAPNAIVNYVDSTVTIPLPQQNISISTTSSSTNILTTTGIPIIGTVAYFNVIITASNITGILYQGMPVVFSNSMGNIQAGTVYYVLYIANSTTFIITDSLITKDIFVQTNAFALGFNFVQPATTNMIVNEPIVFNGVGFGGVVIGKTYYVKSIPTSTTFTISEKVMGSEVALTTDSGNMSILITPYITDGSIITVRRSTSDGSLPPQEIDYDTSLSGGDMTYSTANGIAADEIIVDGDGFVTPTTSPAPEEVVPGQVIDTLAIKVFEQPSSGAANIKVDNFIGNGQNKNFAITQTINSPEAVIVKVDDVIKEYNVDYTVNSHTNYIEFNTAPVLNSIVTVFSIGYSGSNIIDINYFISDGTSDVYTTRASWVEKTTSLVYVDGVINAVDIIKTDETYTIANQVAIKFNTTPAIGSIINYIIVEGTQQSFSVTSIEKIPLDGLSLEYNINSKIGDILPVETSMIVRVNDTILNGPNNSYFTVKGNQLNYVIDNIKFRPYTVSVTDIVVIANGELLRLGYDYNVELIGINIKLVPATARKYAKKQMIVSIRQNNGYICSPTLNGYTIALNQPYNGEMEIFNSYKNNSLGIQTSMIKVNKSLELTPETIEYYSYSNVTGGIIQLDNPVINDYYIWVIKNGKLLTPSVDYKLNENKISITLQTLPVNEDEFTLMTYGSNIIKQSIAYMQFKDMLNRTHYKRLNLNKQTTLIQPLKFNDSFIYLSDASNFDIPNPVIHRPGIIEICGERIEYYEITGNVLGKLRRGTLGTGIASVYKAGTYVQDIGYSETIPYADENIITQVISTGTNIIDLPYIPSKATNTRVYADGFVSSIPAAYGQSNDIEVFIGGYNDAAIWQPGVDYVVGNIVNVGSYTYQCVVTHTSGLKFKDNYSYWKFFVGNIRLKKSPYKVHDVNVHAESPEGDVQLDADFSVDGENKHLWLTTILEYGTHVTVVKRIGAPWDSMINIMDDTTAIAEFIKNQPGIWYSSMKN